MKYYISDFFHNLTASSGSTLKKYFSSVSGEIPAHGPHNNLIVIAG
jgi:hypothetical protein